MKVGVQSLSAWLPDYVSYTDMERFAATEVPAPVFCSKKPHCPDVPASLRRRLSVLSASTYLVSAAALQNIDKPEQVPIVFASRHGQSIVTEKLLRQIFASEDEISQNSFIMSVHNASCGVLSILQQNKNSAISIASSNASVASLLLEGFLTYQEQQRPVLCVLADESVVGVFEDTTEELNFCFAMAFLLAPPDNDWGIECTIEENWKTGIDTQTPGSIEFLRWLFNSEKNLELKGVSLRKSSALPAEIFQQAISPAESSLPL